MESPKSHHLHVVIFDVPFPPDYGGAMDVYYRLKALKENGFYLHLHVFEYGRGKTVELDRLGEVYYYRRKRSFRYLINRRPFIVASRMSQDLLGRLKEDQHPILFEGIHTTWYLEDAEIRKRLTMVRMHNIEHAYYRGLMQHAKGLKKLFFWWESIKLKSYEPIIRNASYVLAIKPSDAAHFREFNPQTCVVPASLPMESMNTVVEKTEAFALFHGNLSVPENERGAIWVINVLYELLTEDFPLIIAGKNPSEHLQKYADGKKVKMVQNPEEKEMNHLISRAHIHALYSEVNSGSKLKFLSSLSANGHVLVNSGISGDVEKNVHFFSAESPESYLHTFRSLMHEEIRENNIQERRTWLESAYGVQNSVSIIKQVMSGTPPIQSTVLKNARIGLNKKLP